MNKYTIKSYREHDDSKVSRVQDTIGLFLLRGVRSQTLTTETLYYHLPDRVVDTSNRVR